jgi:hypothetical protein
MQGGPCGGVKARCVCQFHQPGLDQTEPPVALNKWPEVGHVDPILGSPPVPVNPSYNGFLCTGQLMAKIRAENAKRSPRSSRQPQLADLGE